MRWVARLLVMLLAMPQARAEGVALCDRAAADPDAAIPACRRRRGESGMNRLLAAAVACGVFLTPLCSDLAFADGRVALVIGNSAYQNAPTLPNPKRDAQAIAASLRKGGYTVVSTNDV